jgi:hypothetical protein
MGGLVTGVVAVGTLVVVAGIIYQIVNGKHSVALAQTGQATITSVTSTLFKS